MSVRFRHCELRTTDVDHARSFYEAVLGRSELSISPLPESARARGAPAHWLGSLGPVDVASESARWIAAGATRLGPPGSPVLRDATGAAVALTAEAGAPDAGVVLHVLNTRDVVRATQEYVDRFGWSPAAPLVLPAPYGALPAFSFVAGEPAKVAIADVSARDSVHVHWLHFFGTSSLDASLEAVRTHGGEVFGVVTRPDGRRGAMCHDPQGAAFGWME